MRRHWYGVCPKHLESTSGHSQCLPAHCCILKSVDQDGRMALATAACEGRVGMVKQLIELGADINALGEVCGHGTIAFSISSHENDELLLWNVGWPNGTDAC